ncbi:hypothetical protein [Pseudomonas phage Astolliot]|nr:hypothetical protein [Pseudomonas phage Astolliot]
MTGRLKNPVAHFMEDFNRPVTMADRKKESKRGKVKHKKRITNDSY